MRRSCAPPIRAPAVAARQALPPRAGWPPGRPADGPTVRASSALERLALSLSHGEAVLAEYYAQALVMWVSRGFDLDDVRLWLNAGPLEHDSGLAERRAGLSAADMSRNVGGTRVLARLRRGEAPASLATRMREGRTRRA